jgi:hypothetical protein
MTAGRLTLAVLSLLTSLPVLGQEPEKRREAATYVFLGTVAPQPGKPGADSGVLVTVNEVYLQKGKFEDQTGRQVEVLDATTKLEETARYVFYTEPVRFGQRITVRALDVAQPPAAAAAVPADRMKQDVGDAFARREIEERAALAELVVVGTVASVRPLERGAAPESEHDPQLQVARLKVEQILKGKTTASEIEFLFAASKDVQWFRAPKFSPGTRGVIMLQRAAAAKEAAKDMARYKVEAQRYVVLHPLDFRPAADIALVQSALKGGRQ